MALDWKLLEALSGAFGIFMAMHFTAIWNILRCILPVLDCYT
jgi:hypothetical protein